ncbi:ribonuclease III [Thermosipho melanesiensis]|uniref:Mini-ribonuclease 3 n=2 Tax=Thermosipho melanesiensis TaxID=46541 RepID=A6LJ32_THEM4|nr:ribonuclease III domain-containing protein [Thermosipho melanesiensis]ABR29933.1 ribonuclease III [Thermosipho melanesiensis BI429]APT73141.1 ribonuclease III [Thermosipho melanesiensis]OOC38537.1 ribonuclease III [Thermosipho melanesiensis]OOC40341.1 ribonuclease III [Thermosipho melanesiensis]OOC40605.1 ribonuclease III [Thermosipho melanesiensis]
MDIFSKVKPNININELSTDSLAYIGDAVFNLYVKLYYFKKTSVRKLHKNTHSIVNRDHQALLLDKILPLLTEEEFSYVKRGINSKGAGKYGNDPAYRKSTGFEVLIGFLYLKNEDRLYNLLTEVLK